VNDPTEIILEPTADKGDQPASNDKTDSKERTGEDKGSYSGI